MYLIVPSRPETGPRDSKTRWTHSQGTRHTVVDYQPFAKPVPFKVDGIYREPEANQRTAIGFYFQVGVRPLDQKAFDAIVKSGLGHVSPKPAAVQRVKKAPATPSLIAADSGEIQQLAMTLATAEAKAQWPSAKIFRAPTGQYFSLIVRHQTGEAHHIAVKSSTESEPRVQLSPAEVAYTNTHAQTYSLWVFYAIDRAMINTCG